MKYIALLFFNCFILLTYGQSNAPIKSKNNQVIIEFIIKGIDANNFEIKITPCSYSRFDDHVEILKIDTDSSYKVSVCKQADIQEVSVNIPNIFNESILIQNGARLEVNLKNSTTKILGNDYSINSYFSLYKKNRVEREVELEEVDDSSFYRKIDSVYNTLSQIDSIFINENPSPFSFIINEQRKSDYYSQLLVHFWRKGKVINKEYLNKIYKFFPRILTNKTSYFYANLQTYIKRSIIFPKYIKSGIVTLTSSEWKEIYDYANANGINDSSSIDQEKFINEITVFLYLRISNYIDSMIESEQADRIKMPINLSNEIQYKMYFDHVLIFLKNRYLFQEAERIYKSRINLMNNLKSEMNSIKIENSNIDFGIHKATTYFHANLYVFKGSNEFELLKFINHISENHSVLIDFWATWCKPCIESMPVSKALSEKISNLPIKFVYLCTSNSSNEENWTNSIINLKQPGIHIYVKDDIMSKLMNIFQLKGYPSYMLFSSDKKKWEKVSIHEISIDKITNFIQ